MAYTLDQALDNPEIAVVESNHSWGFHQAVWNITQSYKEAVHAEKRQIKNG